MNTKAMMGGIVAIMGIALYFLFGAYTGQVELRVTAEISATTSRAALKYQAELAEAVAGFHDELNTERRDNEKARNLRIAEINLYRQKAERLARVDPTGFGDDYHVRLARVMCRVEAGSDNMAVETCNSAPPGAFLSDIAVTLTVTPDNAEIWREQCEDGNRDFCDWSLTGFTPQFALTMLSWLEQVDGYAREQGDHIAIIHDMVKMLGKPEAAGEVAR